MSDNDSDNGNCGGRGGRGGKFGDDEKPRERYDPPEPSDDQEVIFGSGITSGINFSKYDKIDVKVSGEKTIRPISTFDECALRPIIVENLKKSGYVTPTPVQKYAFPSIMEGRDLMGCAQTGSGKTAAFLVPIINTFLTDPVELVITGDYVEPQAVIVCPVRELAIQIFYEARKFAYGSNIKCAVAYGGTGVMQQTRNIMRGCHVLVATPGRLNDFVVRGRISFASIRFFVLDEADRMLDMGFITEIEKMLNHGTMKSVGDRQTLMFSATFPEQIQRLASKYLNDYLFIAVGIVGGACSDVEQVIHEVPKFKKKEKLISILKGYEGEKQLSLVFVEQKRTADFIAAYLSENDFPTTSIHGDRLQSQREAALQDFKSGFRPTLVATAVAARGLDIKNVSHVINFDLPQTIDEYVHRIGRTGRVGNKGQATSFYDPDNDGQIATDLAKILRQCNQTVPSFLELAGGGGGDGGDHRSSRPAFGGRDTRKFNKGGRNDDFEEDNEPYSNVPMPNTNDNFDEEW